MFKSSVVRVYNFPKFLKFSRKTVNFRNYSMASETSSLPKDEKLDFMGVWPDIVRDLTEYSKKFDSKISPKHFPKSLQYNVPNGKLNRGISVVLAYKMFCQAKELTDENIRLAQLLGWCVEMLQSYLIINDDIIDGSEKRRGKECWYKLPSVGLSAINNSMMIENGLYYIIHKYFGDKDYYKEIIQLFHEVTFITAIGQLQDLKTAGSDVMTFNMETYKSIVTNKTAYYSYYLPITLAMHMSGVKDPKLFHQTRKVLLEIGNFFQAQDDFIDCFGDPSVTGKIGTDIQEGKCSWLAVVAMQRANEEQKNIMKECYGKKGETLLD
jgi:farnesyl diphosphate synthase